MLQGRRGLAWALCVLAGAIWACESTRNPGGVQRDLIPPNIQLSASQDTQDIAGGLNFSVTATDNLGLKSIRLNFTGGLLGQTDTVFTSAVTTITIPVKITPGSGAGGLITIIGRATDGAGNFAEDTLPIYLVNVDALRVYLLQPTAGAVASQNRYIPIQVAAAQKSGVRRIGWLVGGNPGQTAQRGDSLVNGSAPYPDTLDFVDSVLVTGNSGFFTIVGFAVDSGGRVATTSPITVTILSAFNDNTPPQIEQAVPVRAEANDSVTVHATDPSGITIIGFEVDTGAGVQVRRDSVVLGGTTTDITRKFALGLNALIPPVQVVVQAFACDGASPTANCGVTGATFTVPSPTGAAHADTILIVAGTTVPLPLGGGKISDAIFNARLGELYLTNSSLSRVEIFQVANTTFVAGGIRTAGPTPWGIALWPRDTLGNYGDTIVVANAGGTELSVIDVRPAVRRLVWRQDLPDFIIQKYKVLNVLGAYFAEITEYNVSDRPQYVATVCRPAAGTACAPDQIYALYSTTPTVSSSSPFNGRATLRLEKLINPGSPPNPALLFGHLFWEIGNEGSSGSSDTLRIVIRRGLPYNQTQVVLSACAGVTIDFSTFGLADSTYVRNSGNFTHGFFGEGGTITTSFARVMAYSTRLPMGQVPGAPAFCNTSPDTVNGPTDGGNNNQDFGMSPGIDVRDFISNTGIKVQSIATNFNGGTNLVRADSIYVLDEGLRLKGTSCTLGTDLVSCVTGAPGMDMNYNHDFAAGSPGSTGFGGTRDSTVRVMFAARPDGNIDVFDTFFYGKIGTVPVRDPIIGPLRVARDLAGNQLLFGITARGLVMVKLPAIPNPNPAPRR
jgi:hypothetical protein